MTKLKVGNASRKPPSAWNATFTRLPITMETMIPKTEPQKPSEIASIAKLAKT
jgi:hypothetical protein